MPSCASAVATCFTPASPPRYTVSVSTYMLTDSLLNARMPVSILKLFSAQK